jgi:hypothetical protein
MTLFFPHNSTKWHTREDKLYRKENIFPLKNKIVLIEDILLLLRRIYPS